MLVVETAPLRRLGAWSPTDPDAPHEPELHTEPTGINSTEPAFLSDGHPLTLDCVHINSDIVFGLLHLIGIKYRPQLANLPDQRLWRFDDKLSLTLERVAGTHSWSAGKGLGGTTLGLIVSGSP